MVEGTRADTARETFEAQHLRLWRAVAAWSGSSEVADEAVAETFAQLLRRGDAVLDPVAWVWQTAFRIAAAELQRRRADVRYTCGVTNHWMRTRHRTTSHHLRRTDEEPVRSPRRHCGDRPRAARRVRR